MAYFDNAATTYPKPECVYSFMDEFYRSAGGSAGRGNYQLAQSAKNLVEDTRKRISNTLTLPSEASCICANGYNCAECHYSRPYKNWC